LRPQVSVLDVKMPGLEGPEVLREIRRRGVETRVIFLSAMLDRDVVYDALAAGASGYLSKHATADEVWDAVEVVAAGGTVIPSEVQTGLVEHIRNRERAAEEARTRPRLAGVVGRPGRRLRSAAVSGAVANDEPRAHIVLRRL